MKHFPGFDEIPNMIGMLADSAEAIEKYGVKFVLPMIGKDFGFRRFWLSSKHSVSNGLDSVMYFVIEAHSGVAFGVGDTKGSAIGNARNAIRKFGEYFDSIVLQVIEEREIRRKADKKALVSMLDVSKPSDKVRPISARRKGIFEKSGGHCHYCDCTLSLHEEWHIEHMTPRARGGLDDMDNLVAACRSCNYSKKTKTAEEFIAHRAKRAGAKA